MRKKFYLIAFAVIIAFIGLTITDSRADYVCGDANSDGALNVSDAVFIINYVFIGGSPAPDPDCCEEFGLGALMDIDGNMYVTIKIGDQWWMAENLKITHYRNGDPIPNVADGGAWSSLTSGAYCDYANHIGNVDVYGRLYNWYAITDSRNIAPEGWHIPTDEEWKQLEMYLGMSQEDADAIDWRGTDEGGKLKEVGTTHWNSPNTGATNESGFTALPGGYRYAATGIYDNIGIYAHFWSSTEYESDTYYIWTRALHYDYSGVYRNAHSKPHGFSVRCVKD